MHKTYKTVGTCSKEINFDIEDNKIHNVSFVGGCNGNLKAVSSLVEGQDIDSIETQSQGANIEVSLNFYKDLAGYYQ